MKFSLHGGKEVGLDFAQTVLLFVGVLMGILSVLGLSLMFIDFVRWLLW